jgi:hypothetical protein
VNELAEPHAPDSRRFWWLLAALVALSGCLYVGQRWSPSSYAIVLEALGVQDRGLVAGIPRAERGDEFAWQTPLLQMTLRSGFRRFDATPPYFEDLRTLYAMPIKDWALIFKPQFWMFFIASPAVAYSFYQFLLMAMFVVGYTALFTRLGGRPIDALLMALVLFFSSYFQYWWDGSANFFNPFFPWIALAPLWAIPFAARLALFFWLLVGGLLTYFYPPNAIALGFVAAIIWLAIRPDWLEWRKVLALALTAGAAGALVLFYLRDAIRILSGTVYPGHRVASGGGVSWRWWLTQFLPTSHMNHHVPLIPAPNICEISTVGSIYVLAALFFIPWKRVFSESTREDWRKWRWLGLGLAATQAWMTLPLPSWVGYPLLWHLVPPGRMVVAGGIMLLTLVFVIAQRWSPRFSPFTCLSFALTLVLAWALFKKPHGIGIEEAYRDWIYAAPVVLAAALVGLGLLSAARANTLLIGSAAILGAVSFGTFNPIQKTTTIFSTHRTPVTAAFDRQLRLEGRGFLLVPWGSSFFAHSGLPLVALGYPSIAYSTFDPALDLWRKLFPDLPADEFNRIFNNVGTFALDDVPAPRWQPIYTVAPVAPFKRPGVTICDVIRPSRANMAASVGCPPPALSLPPGGSHASPQSPVASGVSGQATGGAP